MAEKLRFSTNAKLGKLIGRELITNNIIAIFELIKNSYDAFAEIVNIEFINFQTTGKDKDLEQQRNEVISTSNSKIIISDNGKGMTFEEIKKNWMQIGTNNKANINVESLEIKRRVITRTVNGEKGIGRFGADKIGQNLLLKSIGGSGEKRSTMKINWDVFDDTKQDITDFVFDCNVESLDVPLNTGVSLELSQLRDKWTGKDIINLKKQLKKMISPFRQEQNDFNIYLKFGLFEEQIENDSFDNPTVGISVDLKQTGEMFCEIFDKFEKIKEKRKNPPPVFGPVQLKILYLDKTAKRNFALKMGIPTREYGNIKLFRDDFRILPYGEKENDWLGIDNKHAQAVFRSLGTRDIIGYVQITKKYNGVLQDATNRQGLNEDTIEFDDFKNFIWDCLHMLESYIFMQIKADAEKQGKLIDVKVVELRENLSSLRKELPNFYNEIRLGTGEKKDLVKKTMNTFKEVENNIIQVEKANKQLSNRLVVMEKIVGTESVLYDLLHAIKNKLSMLDSKLLDISFEAQNKGISFDLKMVPKMVKEISTMVAAALKRTSPTRTKKQYVDLSNIIRSFIEEKNFIYTKINIEFISKTPGRVKCNTDGFRILLDNLMNNSVKAMKNISTKKILIQIVEDNDHVRITFEDNGVGVEIEDAPYIFNVSFSKTKGSGIGLATAYQYMKDEKGDISLIRDSTLGGAKFEIKFLKN